MTVIDNIENMIKNDNLSVNKRPDLLSEWDYDENSEAGINVNMITCGSNVKAWWRCDVCHGSYMMVVKNKTSRHGCPFCAGQKALKGFNDLQSCYPDLIEKELDWDENDKHGLKPDEIIKTSYVKTWWDCQKCGNKFKMSPSDRKRGRGCPFCAGKQVLKGFNDLQSKYPDLIKEWDEGNKIKPYEVTCGSRAIVCWHCNYDHKYKMSIYNRIKGHGCPYCAGSKVLKGFNDLQSCRSELMKCWNWHDNNNAGIRPDEVTCGSNIEASWHCDVCNGDYMMKISMKTNGIGCPICAGKQVLKGFNDLQSKRPDLIKEWDRDKNGKDGLKPDEITSSSGITVSWICAKCKHKWKAKAYNRTSANKSGCPACWQSSHKSKQEDEVADYINEYLCEHYGNLSFTIHRSIKFSQIYKKMNINVNNMNASIRKHLLKELDIYISELGIAIEYDGDYWHSDDLIMMKQGMTNDEMHEIKKTLCKQAGIKLHFITEHDWLHDTENVKRRINEMINNSIAKRNSITKK